MEAMAKQAAPDANLAEELAKTEKMEAMLQKPDRGLDV